MTAPLWAAQPPVTVVAPAKVNLFLHITGRRDDGLHELESLFVFTTRGDTLTVAMAPELSFTLEGPFAPALEVLGGGGEDNLVVRAIKALAAHVGMEPSVSVTLEKNLPVAAGIGGGSADAAAALLALNEFWKLDLPMAELEEIALGLGADVPACLHQVPLIVRGIGEQLTPVETGWTAGILLVNPNEPLSTPDVFRAYRDGGAAFDKPLLGTTVIAQSLGRVENETANTLQDAAISVCPAVGAVLEALRGMSGVTFARMSGSGATCFAIFDTEAAAQAAEKALRQEHPDWWMMADRVG